MNAEKIVLIVGLVLALVAAFIDVPYDTLVLAVLGLVLGFLGIGDSDRLLFLVLAVALVTVAGSLGAIDDLIGQNILTGILSNVSALISAAAVAVIGKIIAGKVTS